MGIEGDDYQDYFLAKPFLTMIEAGRIPVSGADDKARRILRVQHSIGMYDNNRKMVLEIQKHITISPNK